MQHHSQVPNMVLHIAEFFCLSLIGISLYLLLASRTGEAHTVWQSLHPAFIPSLFTETFLLAILLMFSKKSYRTLFLIIVNSVLVHSLFSIIFPAGDLSGQQTVLGLTRRVFDNSILHGLSGWPNPKVSVLIVETFKGTNLQAALSTIAARMLGIDILHVHLYLVPILWGVFVPIASFLVTKTIGGNEKAALLSSLVLSVFPYTIYFGAISVPNSLGFIFFFYSLYFMLKYLSSSDSTALLWVLVFSSFSFLSHYLTGVMAFSFLILALAFKIQRSKGTAPKDARSLLIIAFMISVILLPLSFVYLRLLGTSSNPAFTLEKLHELPLVEIIALFLLGEPVARFDITSASLIVIGPLLAFFSMAYLLHRSRTYSASGRLLTYFLFTAFLVVLIDYRILGIFMKGLPLNEERLWVFGDFISAPFVALAICQSVNPIKAFLETRSPAFSHASLRTLSKSLLLALNVLIAFLLGGWVVSSIGVAYPHVAPLQTTWYELEAARYIQENTHQEYVVIGDIWTVYAGEVIVGINNPKAYYFEEYNRTGYDLFSEMKEEPNTQWMVQAMNYTNTQVAYFIVTEPRLGTDEFSNVVSKVLQSALPLYATFGNGKLYVFYYKKGW